VIVLVLFGVYLVANLSKFKPILHLRVPLLALIALTDVAIIFSNGFFTKFIVRPFDIALKIPESFYLSLISSIGNFLAPAGTGFVLRAIYLKRKYSLAYVNYGSTLFGNYVIILFFNSLAGLISLLLIGEKHNNQSDILALVFVLILIFSLGVTLIKIPFIKPKQVADKFAARVLRTIHKVSLGWKQIISHPKLLWQLSGIAVVNLAFSILAVWLIILSLHLHANFGPLLLFGVLSSLSIFINITPANLGIKEAVYIFSSNILGFSISQILLIALVDRGVQFLVLAIGWLAAGKKTLGSLKSA